MNGYHPVYNDLPCEYESNVLDGALERFANICDRLNLRVNYTEVELEEVDGVLTPMATVWCNDARYECFDWEDFKYILRAHFATVKKDLK